MKLKNKLRSKRGESFVEILIAILIVALGCVLIATMYSSAMNLNLTASKKDDEFYKDVSQMEQLFDESEPSDKTKKAEIKDEYNNSLSVPIDIYGDDNAAYKR